MKKPQLIWIFVHFILIFQFSVLLALHSGTQLAVEINMAEAQLLLGKEVAR